MIVDRRFEAAVAAHRAGRLDEAEAGYREVLSVVPGHSGVLSNLGRIARARGDLKTAIEFYRRAAAQPSAPAEVHYNLGNALLAADALEEAAHAYRSALRVTPGFARAQEGLAQAIERLADPDGLTRRANDLFLSGEGDAAVALLQRAVKLRPDDPTTLQNLGFLYRSTGHYRKALKAYEHAGRLSDSALIAVETANCLVNLGRPAEARDRLERLLATPQGRRAAASSYLMSLLYDPGNEPIWIRDEHQRLTAEWTATPAKPTRRAGARLRVGYLTADFFGRHPVAQFIAPLIAAHRDAELRLDSYAYDSKPRSDATAAELGRLVAIRSIEGLSDEEAAEIIRRDDLDLLVDLSGHTSGRRLAILGLGAARRTACFIGYPSTTGFRGVDWLIGDKTVFPVGAERLYTEKLARLPSAFLAFAPPDEMPAPRRERRPGPVTFGSLNHLPKLNPEVVALWSRILESAPGSHLLLQCAAFAEPETVDEVRTAFEKRGVGAGRLALAPPQPFGMAMRRYFDIDIALDPFPYNGGTTTAHALFMGAPVVTLEGRYFCGRMGASLVRAAGHPEWIAQTADQYVAIAVALARAIADGEDVRGALLASNKAAALFDVDAYARDVARLYREISS
jgi:predicted O-linked N-acetylglucosamine transferase (SPINDLY family)